MRSIVRVAVGLFALLVVGTASSALAAGPYMLMKVGSIGGNSQIVDHKGWINVVAFRQEVSNPLPPSPDVGPFMVYKRLDRASVHLAYQAITGTVFPEVVLDYGTVVNGQFLLEYQVRLQNARITHVAPDMTAGQEGGEAVHFEGHVSASSSVTYKYNSYDSDGNLKAEVERTVPWY